MNRKYFSKFKRLFQVSNFGSSSKISLFIFFLTNMFCRAPKHIKQAHNHQHVARPQWTYDGTLEWCKAGVIVERSSLTRSSRPAGAIVTGRALAWRLTRSESHWRSSAKGLGPVAASTSSVPRPRPSPRLRLMTRIWQYWPAGAADAARPDRLGV